MILSHPLHFGSVMMCLVDKWRSHTNAYALTDVLALNEI